MKEIWKEYKTYSSNGKTLRTWIEISNLGNIKGHLFKYKEYDESEAVSYDSNGRKLLCGKPFYRIVDELFRGKKPKGIDLHHADFDKTNDRLDNILRLTREEHMRIHGIGENNNMHTHEYSDETRKKMSDSAKKRGCNIKGLQLYNNGKIQIYADSCPEGFVPGGIKGRHYKKKSEAAKQMRFYTNGEKNIRIKVGEPIPDGYVRGFKKNLKSL